MFYPCIVSIHCPFIIRLIIVYPFVVNCLFMYLALIMHLDLAIINLSSINYPFTTHISPHIVLCSSVCYRCTSNLFSMYFPFCHHCFIHMPYIYRPIFFFIASIYYQFPSIKFHISVQNVQILSIVQPLYPAIIHLALCIIHVPSMLYPYKNTIPFLPIVHPCAIHRKSLLQDV